MSIPAIEWRGSYRTRHTKSETIHVASVDSDGDSIVYAHEFHEADLLHNMGDTDFPRRVPELDATSGAPLDGIIAVANRGLAIAGPKRRRAFPGSGPGWRRF